MRSLVIRLPIRLRAITGAIHDVSFAPGASAISSSDSRRVRRADFWNAGTSNHRFDKRFFVAASSCAALGSFALASAAGAIRCEEPQAQTRRVCVAKVSDIAEGTLREVKVPGSAGDVIMMACIDGNFYATGASCSHYSAPLSKGVFAKDRMHVVCPWHDAAFDIRTGQPVRGPGLQAIPTYPVSVEDDKLVVELPVGDNLEDFANPRAVRRSPDDARTFLIVGGGPAGITAADALRQEGFEGRLVVLSSEKHLPYDRPVLSKNLSRAADPASLSLRDADYLAALDIEFIGGATVTHLDAEKRVARVANGQEFGYDSALVATGGKPRRLPVPGGSLPGVMVLRTPEDAQQISERCTAGSRVVVVGSSFIGMEVAATLKKMGCEVTVLGMESVPFERVLGKKLGDAVRSFFETKGVKFIGQATVSEIRQSGAGKLETALKGGKMLPCDAVVVGVGVAPNADFVSGAEKARDGSLVVSACMQTTAPGLFAAGDVATYTPPAAEGQAARRIEHWEVAMSQGRVAARNMLGKDVPFDTTPFFWTSLFGKNLRYVGYCTEFDDLIVDGDLQKLTFVAYYCHKGAVRAVATMARDPVAVAAGELMRMGQMPPPDMLKKLPPGGSAAALAEKLRQSL